MRHNIKSISVLIELAILALLSTSTSLMAQKQPPVAYSAEEVQEVTQNLADGNRIHTETHTKIYRDHAGRVRKESGDWASIYDPVTGVGYLLDLKNQTFHKLTFNISTTPPNPTQASREEGVVYVTFGASVNGSFSYNATMNLPQSSGFDSSSHFNSGGGIPNSKLNADGSPNTEQVNDIKERFTMGIEESHAMNRPPAVKPKSENLGKQSFDGIIARGSRTTRTYEAGTIGNEQPIQTIDEYWFSEELKTAVMTKHSDPRTGDRTTKLINIVTGDPSAVVFLVPAGFKEVSVESSNKTEK